MIFSSNTSQRIFQSAVLDWLDMIQVQWNEAPVMEEIDQWEELVARVGRNDPSAQQEFVERLWPLVSGVIVKLCPRRDSVEDLAQESFVKIFKNLSRFRGGSLTGWVSQIARRTAYDALRKQRVRPEWTFSDLEYEYNDSDLVHSDDVSHRAGEAKEILALLFRKIPPETAWLLDQVELKERSINEVSTEMGWTSAAGRLRLMRARRKLKSAYKLLDPS